MPDEPSPRQKHIEVLWIKIAALRGNLRIAEAANDPAVIEHIQTELGWRLHELDLMTSDPEPAQGTTP
jgi:hypothetical protein